MRRGNFYTVMGLLVVVILSGVGVVYAKYESRKLFREIEKNRVEKNAIEAEWGRLQLELSARTNYGSVDKKARKDLRLRVPEADEIVVIEPE